MFFFQDFNDNAPVFLSPPSNFTLRVQENETIGAEVVRVHAIDTDIGRLLMYMIYSLFFERIILTRFHLDSTFI